MAKKLTKKQKRELNKIATNHWKVLLVLFLIVVVFVVVAYFMGWIDLLINKFKDDDEGGLSSAGGHTTTLNEFRDLEVAFLDIGQGDCIILELPDGKTMIIDSGDSNSDQQVIYDYTTENNITTFDYLLLTHQDADHVHNMDWVLENYKVNYIFRPNVYSTHDYADSVPDEFNPEITDDDATVSTSKAYAEFLVSAYAENVPTEIVNKDSDFTNTIKVGEQTMDYSFNFLTPTAKKSDVHYGNANDYSPIVMLEYAGKRIMFNGDAEEEALAEYIDTYGSQYNIDVYKVGHHGSENATTSEFLSAVDPEYAVIQCGFDNSYGHPHEVVLDRLKNHDSDMQIYRNDTNGDIILEINPSGQIFWQFESSDMSNNLLSGDELVVARGVSLGNINVRNQDEVDYLINYLSQGIISYRREYMV